jgi:hypothetical protein
MTLAIWCSRSGLFSTRGEIFTRESEVSTMRWLTFSVLAALIWPGSGAASEPPTGWRDPPQATDKTDPTPIIEIELDGGVEARDLPNWQHPQPRRELRQSRYRSEVEDAIFRTLDWLAGHQDTDGGWSFDHTCAPRCADRCPDPGQAVDARRAASSLALLALLGAGQTHRHGQYAGTVRHGLHFLLEQDDHKPCVLPNGKPWVVADAWIATVLCSLISQTGDKRLIPHAQRAIACLICRQDPTTGGWPMTLGGPTDPAATAWAIGALHSAEWTRQLELSPEPLAAAVASMDRIACSDSYFTPDESGDPSGDPTRDYFISQTIRQQPSHRAELGPWNRKLRLRLIESQSKEGHARGSWRPTVHAQAEAGGRLYETVLNVLSLEVYFQHLPLWRCRPTAAVEQAAGS